MGFKIKIYSEEHSKAVQEKLFEIGYSWNGSKDIKYTYLDRIMFYENIIHGIFVNSASNFDSPDYNYFETVTLDDLYSGRFKKEVSLKLTSDYTAYLKDGFVQVGCQEIPFEKIEELYNLIYKS